jgi:hypothetical protein
MSFLPEDDLEVLKRREIVYELKVEKLPDGNERRAIVFPGFTFEGNLYTENENGRVPCLTCDLLVIVPSGYATTRLDSFYTIPILKRADGQDPECAAGRADLFGRNGWQFWSRHLTESEWRVGIDGLETFLQYIRAELRRA